MIYAGEPVSNDNRRTESRTSGGSGGRRRGDTAGAGTRGTHYAGLYASRVPAA